MKLSIQKVSEDCLCSKIDSCGKEMSKGSEEASREFHRLFDQRKVSGEMQVSEEFMFAFYDHPEAMYKWGNRLLLGDGVTRDGDEAFQWFLRSAQKGYLPAVKRVIYCYQIGEGVEKSISGANAWKKRLIELLQRSTAWIDRESFR